MVSTKKQEVVKELKALIEKQQIVGVVNMHKLPGRQLFSIKEKLKGKAKVKVAKKSLILLALKGAKKQGIEGLEALLKEQPALLFSDQNPFDLAAILTASKSKASAKAGDIAPSDILISAGPTSLAAGPAIGELQKAGIPASVEGGKIAVKKDTIVVRAGEKISKEVADALAKLGIEPMEIGLDLLAVLDGGTIYKKDILFIPKEKYLDDLKTAYLNALNLSVGIEFVSKDNVKIFISQAYKKALNLAVNGKIMTPESIKYLLQKANAEMQTLQSKVKG